MEYLDNKIKDLTTKLQEMIKIKETLEKELHNIHRQMEQTVYAIAELDDVRKNINQEKEDEEKL